MANSSTQRHSWSRVTPVRGFTIIELLVVVGIISVLLGLLLPALGGVKRRSHKTTEINSIKNLGQAWMMYANNNNDAALPGFLETPVQAAPVPNVSRGWGVSYDYPDRTKIPVDATNIAGPWTWRLLSYLDYNHEMMHAHLGESDADSLGMIAEAQSIAYEPAFGYNGYYIGGHWSMISGGPGSPNYAAQKFYNHCALPTLNGPGGAPLSIPSTVAQINRSADLVTFCASTKVAPGGQAFYSAVKLPSDRAGWHFVTPPTVGNVPQWRPFEQEPNTAFEVIGPGDAYVPLGRHTGTIAVLYADGHTDSQSYYALYSARKWIDNAESWDYTHALCPP